MPRIVISPRSTASSSGRSSAASSGRFRRSQGPGTWPIADHSVPADEVATILFTSRHETLEELIDAAPDDPHWPRRLELLVALAAQGTGTLPVGEKVTGLLRSAPDARPFLRAIRALRHTAAEEAVIAALPRSPAAAGTSTSRSTPPDHSSS